MGFNLAGLQYMQNKIEENEEVCLFVSTSKNTKNKKSKRQGKFVLAQ